MIIGSSLNSHSNYRYKTVPELMGRPGQSKYQGLEIQWVYYGTLVREVEILKISGPKKCAHLYTLANIYKPLSVLPQSPQNLH